MLACHKVTPSLTLYFSDCRRDVSPQLLQLLAGAYAPGTVKNIRSAIRVYLAFMIKNQFPVFPPNIMHVAQFYAHLLSRLTAMGSLANYQSAVNTFYKLYGVHLDTADIVFKLLNMSAKKHLTTAPVQKPPLEFAHLLQMISIVNSQDPTEVAFINAIVIGFMATLRRSNICPPSPTQYDEHKHLRREDVLMTQDGLVVVLRWTKTNQASQHLFKIPIAFSGDDRFDPPRIFRLFNQRYPVKPADPCFSFYAENRLFVLTHSDLARMLNRFLSDIGVPADAYTTHSIRKGGTTAFHRAGVRSELLKAHGTWQSDAYQTYLGHSYADLLSVSQSVYKNL